MSDETQDKAKDFVFPPWNERICPFTIDKGTAAKCLGPACMLFQQQTVTKQEPRTNDAGRVEFVVSHEVHGACAIGVLPGSIESLPTRMINLQLQLANQAQGRKIVPAGIQ